MDLASKVTVSQSAVTFFMDFFIIEERENERSGYGARGTGKKLFIEEH